MPPDYTFVSGDTLPILTDTLTYSNGTVAEPEEVALTMRALTASEQVSLAGASAVVSKPKGEVSFSPAEADGAVPGDYLGNWRAKINGKQMTFPTTGYLWIRVEGNLTSKGGAQLVGLPEVKEYLNIPANDRVHDVKLIGHIEAVKPLIEDVTGPIAVQVYDEWYEGGHSTISLRHKPSYGYGTNPVLTPMAASEYRGPIEYDLSIVSTPTAGSVYSVMFNKELGTAVRRTAGGGTYNFWWDPSHPQQSVHLVYAAGQEKVPQNVSLAVKEAIRVNYLTTQETGAGRRTVADIEEPAVPLGFFLPRRCLELLSPTRRAPTVA